MAQFPALPIWTDAYLADTAHLTNEEHGCYLRLLMYAWRSPDCSLPDDDRRLALMLGLTPKKWAAVKPAVIQFWKHDGEKWTQKRLSQERERVASIQEQRSEAGRASAASRARRSKRSSNESAPAGNDSVQRQSKSTGHEKSDGAQSNLLENNNQDATSVATDGGTSGTTAAQESISISNNIKTGTKRGTRLPPDWALSDQWRRWALAEYPNLERGKLDTEAAKFRDYWHSKAGQQAAKLDWFATWRNWCRTAFGVPPVKVEGQAADMTSLDRWKDEALFAECERINGRRAPSSVQHWSFPNQVVAQARRKLKKD